MELDHIEYTVELRTPVFPTEDKNTVMFCLEEIFPNTEWEFIDDELTGKTEDLQHFKEILEDARIRDTARKYMESNVEGDQCIFELSKQASCTGKINFSELKQPLGPVEVKIKSPDIEFLIDALTETGER
ncbi:MAG: RNA-binding domain-containing protein [Thermoplasmata archaeon]